MRTLPRPKRGLAPVLTPAGTVAVAATLGFILASAEVPAGSVVLIEQQDANLRPVETDLFVRHAILELTRKGVIVVEASGNAGTDLDNHNDIFFGQTLNPDSGAFFETGAIIVTGASSDVPHTRRPFTNLGKRIDCYAWGETSLPPHRYRTRLPDSPTQSRLAAVRWLRRSSPAS
jgi:hypothetical protein